MFVDDRCDVWHAAVTQLDGVSIKNFVKFRVFRDNILMIYF